MLLGQALSGVPPDPASPGQWKTAETPGKSSGSILLPEIQLAVDSMGVDAAKEPRAHAKEPKNRTGNVCFFFCFSAQFADLNCTSRIGLIAQHISAVFFHSSLEFHVVNPEKSKAELRHA